MPYLKVYVHFVWTTKHREPYLSTLELRQIVWKHIRETSFDKGILIDHINGFAEHCHCLVSMNATMPICKVMQLIKGESSYWINKQGLCDSKFDWQDDYYGVSIGVSELARIRNYIRNQEEHHKSKSFEAENKEESYGL